MDGGVLGQDRDAALAFEIVAVHRPFGDAFVGAEDAALPEHGVDQGGLAVVDVGDDRNVSAKGIGDRCNDFCEKDIQFEYNRLVYSYIPESRIWNAAGGRSGLKMSLFSPN